METKTAITLYIIGIIMAIAGAYSRTILIANFVILFTIAIFGNFFIKN